MSLARVLSSFVLALTLTLTFSMSAARAETQDPQALFDKGAKALSSGEYSAAIDLFESLADRGFLHPDASFDRGLAYVMRVKAGADRPGDLGRAAAAFEETLLLRPGDPDADHALDLVRAEVTRRRSKKNKDAIDVRPTLDRMLIGLATERSWGIAAMACSLLLALGLVFRLRYATGSRHVAGSVLALVSVLGLAAFVPLTYGARWLRLETRAGVIVIPEARMADESGRSIGAEPIPEAARVETSERRGGLIHVRWGASEGWVPVGSVRLIGP